MSNSVLLTDGHTWRVIGPGSHHESGLITSFPQASEPRPCVVTYGVQPSHVAAIIRAHCDAHRGILNLEAMLEELVSIGCGVSQPQTSTVEG